MCLASILEIVKVSSSSHLRLGVNSSSSIIDFFFLCGVKYIFYDSSGVLIVSRLCSAVEIFSAVPNDSLVFINLGKLHTDIAILLTLLLFSF